MSGVVQIISCFLPPDHPDAIERFDLNESIDSSSSNLVQVLQYPSKEYGPTFGTMEWATKAPSCPSVDLNNLL
jgi:hypothetical protein